MRYLIIIFVLAFSGFVLGDGDKEGRQGNELYEQGSFGPAAEAYRRGLAALRENSPAGIRYGLENNLGAALLKSGDAAAAGEAFERALISAPGAADVARTAYNAGNAAYSAEESERALAHYRQSLLNDPDNPDAKFNYEFVKRKLEQQQQQQQQQRGDGEQEDDQEQQQEQNGQGEQDQEQEPSQRESDQQQDGGDDEQQGEQPEDRPSEQSRSSPQDSPEKLSEEQAQRILQALQNEEEQLLRQVQRKDARARPVEKDW